MTAPNHSSIDARVDRHFRHEMEDDVEGGSTLQEGIIAIGLRTGAVSQIAALLPILWDLRGFAGKEIESR